MSIIGISRDLRGFTIIELLIVIAIVAILAAIAIPQFTRYKKRTHAIVLDSDVKNAYAAAQIFLIDNPNGTVDNSSKLKYGGYTSTPEIIFGSGNMTIDSGSIIIISTMADDSSNVATLFYNGNVDITAD